MAKVREVSDTILLVDDEESVRKTFLEWLQSTDLGCEILTAADAEEALVQANQHQIDLAILDWNLGAGNDGLRLLEDLTVFNPDVVAIMITGYAHQATPLKAMKMGVRDYLDKNQDLSRTSFLNAVRCQLDRIRPAKRERILHQELMSFRSALEKILPLVQATTALSDPAPLPSVITHLFQFLIRTTGAEDGVLLMHGYDSQRHPAEIYRAYDAQGQLRPEPTTPFARSLAGMVISLQEPFTMSPSQQTDESNTFELQDFEKGRSSLLAAPLQVNPQLQVVLELFDKKLPGRENTPILEEGGQEAFTAADRQLAAAAADFASEMLRQALAERQGQHMLFHAVDAAVKTSESLTASLEASRTIRPEDPPPAEVMDRLREGWQAGSDPALKADDALRLAEAIRVLNLRHGPSAVRHCIRLVESLRQLLDELLGG